jgi:cytochrome P450
VTLAGSSLPPGPTLPILGALVGPGRDPLKMFTRFAREFGDITFFRLGGERCYFINDPQAIRDVLVTHQRNFTKSRGLERAKKLLGNGLLTAEGATHLRHRRLLQPAFHRDRILGYAQVMIDSAVRTRERWGDGETLDMSKEMMRLTLSIAGKTLFDTDVESSADEVGVAVTEVLESFWLNLLPGADYLEKLPIPRLRRAHAARRRLDALIYEMIAARRASGVDHGDLLSMLIAASDTSAVAPDGAMVDRSAAPGASAVAPDGTVADKPGAPGLSDEEIRDEAMTLLLAGHETTANALTWTLYLLSQNPSAESRLRAELDRVLGARPPSPRDYSALTYTRRVVTESMRLYPPAWIIGRRAIDEYAIGEYRLPPRAIVFMSPFVMHRDGRFYDQPEQFNPDRWTPDFEAALPRFAYFPFGGGARQCIGEQFAWMEAVLVLATLMQGRSLQLDPAQRIVPQPLVTLRSKYGMKVRVTRSSSGR